MQYVLELSRNFDYHYEMRLVHTLESPPLGSDYYKTFLKNLKIYA